MKKNKASSLHMSPRKTLSFTQQLRRRLLWVMGGVFVLIMVIGSFSFYKTYDTMARNDLAVVKRTLTALRTDWRALSHHRDVKPALWLATHLPRHSRLILEHKGQKIAVPQSPLKLEGWPRREITLTRQLDANTTLTLETIIVPDTPYWLFMLRPLAAIASITLLLLWSLGRWTRQQEKRFDALEQIIDGYRKHDDAQVQQTLQTFDRHTRQPDELNHSVAALQQAMDEIQRLNAMAQKTYSLLGKLNEVIVEVNENGTIEQTNETWHRYFADNITHLNEIIHPEDREGWRWALQKCQEQDRHLIRQRMRFMVRGTPRWFEARFFCEKTDRGLQLIGILQDIQQSYEHERTIHHMAFHDTLTELPNRVLMEDRLNTAMAMAHRDDTHVGVLFFDLDHFKQINDTLGHEVGDQLLIQVADRVQRIIRPHDTLCRWGGDEFVLLAPRLKCCEDTKVIARKVREAIARTFEIDGHQLNISTSIGIACYPDDSDSLQALLSFADKAMFHAKAQGRNQVVAFADMGTQGDAKQALYLQHRLHTAIQDGAIEVWYQPIVEITTGRVQAVEALARWHDDELGWISPATFIPMAENLGLICPLGQHIIERALDDLKQLKENDLLAQVHINLSTRQLFSHVFAQWLHEACEQRALLPQQLVLEVTESIALRDVAHALEQLHALQQQSYWVALDDFGTGYASLSQLDELRPVEVKIDRSFIEKLDNEAGRMTLRGIVDIARASDIRVVAEGVETADQLEAARKAGVQLVQGYYYARPMPLEALIDFLQAQKTRPEDGQN